MKLIVMAVVVALLAALVPGAMADGSGCKCDSKGEKGHMFSHHEIERIDMVKTFTGMSNNTMMFQVPALAITHKGGKVATVTFTTPLTGGYNTAHDAGFLTTKGMDSADIAVRPLSNATLNVAGGSLVVSAKDIKVLLDDRDMTVLEYCRIGIYRPDGQGYEFRLDKPLKAVLLKDRKMMVIDAYPALTDTLSEYMISATFPADAPPMLVRDIAAAEMAHGVSTIGTAPRTRPSTPTAGPTPMPTPAPTPVPTETPSPVPTP